MGQVRGMLKVRRQWGPQAALVLQPSGHELCRAAFRCSCHPARHRGDEACLGSFYMYMNKICLCTKAEMTVR